MQVRHIHLTRGLSGGRKVEWRRTFGQRKEDAVNKLRARQGWRRTGVYNEAVHDLMEKGATSTPRAIDLIKRWKPPPPPKEPQIRAAISDFCIRAEAVEEKWHYTQRRPSRALVTNPSASTTETARRYCVLAYGWARKVTQFAVPDPSGYDYAGLRATPGTTSIATARVTSPYLVGDLAHYEGHVSVCRKGGSVERRRSSPASARGGPAPDEP